MSCEIFKPRFYWVGLSALAGASGCGAELSEETLQRAQNHPRAVGESRCSAPHALEVQVREGSELLQRNKATIVGKAFLLGVDEARTAFLLSIFMHETQDCAAPVRKDGARGPTTGKYSAANLRADTLRKLEVDRDDWRALDGQERLADAVGLVNAAVEKMGAMSFCRHHKGSQMALGEKVPEKVLRYVKEIQAAQALLMERRELWSSAHRVTAVHAEGRGRL